MLGSTTPEPITYSQAVLNYIGEAKREKMWILLAGVGVLVGFSLLSAKRSRRSRYEL